MDIRFIQHEGRVTPGAYIEWAARHGCGVKCTRTFEYEPVPAEADADMLVVLGGGQNPATTKEECDYFDAEAEKRLILRYIDSDRIVIGICLGAQLVGEALGAKYSHSPEKEIGAMQARLTEKGRSDPLFNAFPDTFPAGSWHNDMPGLTENSVIIAESDGCPRQIVRYGEFVYGFQTHMELTHEIIAAGVKAAGDELKRGGKYVQTAEELLAYDFTEMNELLFTFLDALVSKKAGR